jgi:hypothetical protein
MAGRSVYQPLLDFLAAAVGETLTLSFDEIEAILDRPLAVSAQVSPSCWTGTAVPFVRTLHAMGWRAHLDVPTHHVAFRRASDAQRRKSKMMGGAHWDTVYMEALAEEFESPVLGTILVPDQPR